MILSVPTVVRTIIHIHRPRFWMLAGAAALLQLPPLPAVSAAIAAVLLLPVLGEPEITKDIIHTVNAA